MCTFCRFFARFLSGTPATVPALFGPSMAWSSRRLAERFFHYGLSATLCTPCLVHAYKIPQMFPILGIADSPTFPAAEEDVGAFRGLPIAPVHRKLGPTFEFRRYNAVTSESRSPAPSTQGVIQFGDADNSNFFQLGGGSVMAEMVGIPEIAKRLKLDGGHGTSLYCSGRRPFLEEFTHLDNLREGFGRRRGRCVGLTAQ